MSKENKIDGHENSFWDRKHPASRAFDHVPHQPDRGVDPRWNNDPLVKYYLNANRRQLAK